MAHDVFISHSSKDKAVADAVCATLEQHHIRCWIAPRDIAPGEEWGESIVSAIHASRVMVLIFSASANDSPQIRREVERAVHSKVVIVPMRIEDVLPQKSLEYFIGSVHWLDAFSKPLEDYLESLVGVVKGILGGADSARAEVRAAIPATKKASPSIWTYAVGGIAVVLLAVLTTFAFLRKHDDAKPDGVTAGSSIAAPTVTTITTMPAAPSEQTNPNGAAASKSATAKSGGAARPPAAVHLRSDKQTISVEEAKVMVVTHNFFRANWNPAGKGPAHQYETKAVQNVLVVVDGGMGLMWQRGGSGSPVQGGMNAAEEYVQGLNTKKYAGFADWRLPTLEEAMSLMTPPEKGQLAEVTEGDDHTVKATNHIDPSFENSAAPFLWTSDLQSPSRGWVVYFMDGICDLESVEYSAYVRAVRSLH
jgi:TIR domain/Protein of unknown function (DUF1566)